MSPGGEIRQRTWFVIAAYNEESVIRSVVLGIRSKYPNVIVVDDGSTDRTGVEAIDAGAILVTHPINLGQGAALQTGITFALRRQAQYIVTFDADGQHSVDDVDSMLDAMAAQNCDVVLGSRFCGTTENLPRMRLFILKAAILFTRLSTGLKLTDTHNGLRVIKAEAARRINLHQNGMAHASEFLEQIARLHMSYIEVPVTIRYTEYSLRKGQKLSNSLNILMDLFVERFTK
jgi:polyprenyl-phospho-N-acetylgalactosaminyl synthase